MIFKPFIKSNARNTNFFTKKKKKLQTADVVSDYR